MDKVISTQFSRVRSALFKKQETALKLKTLEEKIARTKGTALQRFKKSFSAFLFSHNVIGENAENLAHSFDTTMINLVDKALTSQLDIAKVNAKAAVDRYTQVLTEARSAICADVPEQFRTLIQKALSTFNDKVLKLEFDVLINDRERTKAATAKLLTTPVTSSASINAMDLDNVIPATTHSAPTTPRSRSRSNSSNNNRRHVSSVAINNTQNKSVGNNSLRRQQQHTRDNSKRSNKNNKNNNKKNNQQQQHSNQRSNSRSKDSVNRNSTSISNFTRNKNNDWTVVNRNASKNRHNRSKNNNNNMSKKKNQQQRRNIDSRHGNSKTIKNSRSNKSTPKN